MQVDRRPTAERRETPDADGNANDAIPEQSEEDEGARMVSQARAQVVMRLLGERRVLSARAARVDIEDLEERLDLTRILETRFTNDDRCFHDGYPRRYGRRVRSQR